MAENQNARVTSSDYPASRDYLILFQVFLAARVRKQTAYFNEKYVYCIISNNSYKNEQISLLAVRLEYKNYRIFQETAGVRIEYLYKVKRKKKWASFRH